MVNLGDLPVLGLSTLGHNDLASLPLQHQLEWGRAGQGVRERPSPALPPAPEPHTRTPQARWVVSQAGTPGLDQEGGWGQGGKGEDRRQRSSRLPRPTSSQLAQK